MPFLTALFTTAFNAAKALHILPRFSFRSIVRKYSYAFIKRLSSSRRNIIRAVFSYAHTPEEGLQSEYAAPVNIASVLPTLFHGSVWWLQHSTPKALRFDKAVPDRHCASVANGMTLHSAKFPIACMNECSAFIQIPVDRFAGGTLAEDVASALSQRDNGTFFWRKRQNLCLFLSVRWAAPYARFCPLVKTEKQRLSVGFFHFFVVFFF